MKKKRTYMKPTSEVIVIKSHPQLLVGSPAQSRFVDVDVPGYVWDEEGAN